MTRSVRPGGAGTKGWTACAVRETRAADSRPYGAGEIFALFRSDGEIESLRRGRDPSSLSLLRMTDKRAAPSGKTGIRRVSPSRRRRQPPFRQGGLSSDGGRAMISAPTAGTGRLPPSRRLRGMRRATSLGEGGFAGDPQGCPYDVTHPSQGRIR